MARSETTKQSISKQKIMDCHEAKASRNDGFTLAEVLITLVIIGVIAAITVPTLITKYQKEQTVTRLKKAYSALSQTTARAISDYGPITTWEVGETNNANDAKIFADKYITPYLNIMKKTTTYDEGNWNNERIYLNNTRNNYNNSFARFYINDGTSVTCVISYYSTEYSLYVDINGDKKPNKLGRDIFRFVYMLRSDNPQYIGKILPFYNGYTSRDRLLEDVNSFSCNKNQNGSNCATVIMADGWRIADDYPW